MLDKWIGHEVWPLMIEFMIQLIFESENSHRNENYHVGTPIHTNCNHFPFSDTRMPAI